MPEPGDKSDPQLEEAMDWLLRLRDSPSEPRIAEAFEAWIAQSDRHRLAWERALRTWRLMGETKPAHEHLWRRGEARDRIERAAARSRRPSATAPRRHGWKAWAAGATFTLAGSIALVVALPSLMLYLEADHMTGTAETRVVTLDDGSTVHLGADSAISSDINSDAWSVSLLAGEAFFDIVTDPDRPFVVEAEGAEIAVLGTAFNVRLSSDTATVELARGAVDLSLEGAEGNGHVELAPGEMAALDRRTGGITKREIDQENIGAWREGRLFVQNATVGSVVEQLRRYHSAWISVPDSTLAARRVTGLFDLNDPDRALRALVEPYGGKVRTLSPFLRILSRF